MNEQNFKNHSQIVYGFYLTTGVPILILIGIAVCHLLAEDGDKNFGWTMLLIGWILLTFLFRSRSFALKAQDRAIRAEENLRYFQLTAKRIDQRITLQQIIALRFASDEEMPALTQRALDENLTNRQIKELIKNWRADCSRV